MKRAAGIVLALGVSVIVTVGCGQATTTSGSDTVSLLYSLTASSGTLAPRDGVAGYTLTLLGVDADTVQFADRPSRYAGVIPTAGFIAGWPDFFGEDPPNAALVEHERADDGADTVIVTLGAPTYDSAARTLSYEVTLLDDEHAPERLRGWGSTHDEPPASFAAASLFIDDVTGPVVNGCAIQPYTNCPNVDLHGSPGLLAAANLTGANLSGANLQGLDLGGAKLDGATLVAANMQEADLAGATLYRATLSQANLSEANLDYASLIEADLSYADLTRAAFDSTTLYRANLSHADLTQAYVLPNVDMTQVKYCNTKMPDGSIRNDNCP